ncbi:hypothetical protein BJX99DRAFT_265217 [Aspergillus californicus]
MNSLEASNSPKRKMLRTRDQKETSLSKGSTLEPLPPGGDGSNADKDSQIENLTNQLATLEEKYEKLSAVYRQSSRLEKYFCGIPYQYASIDPGDFDKNLRFACLEAHGWAFCNGLMLIKDMEKISKNDKDYIISSLEG